MIGSLVIVAGTLLVATRKTTREPMVEAPKGDVAFAKLGGGAGAPAAGGGGLPARDAPMSAFVDIDMDAEEHCLTDEAVSSAASSDGSCPSRGETVPNSLESETAVLTVHLDGDDDDDG